MPAREGVLTYPDQLLLFNGGRQAQVQSALQIVMCDSLHLYSCQARGGNVRQLAVVALKDSASEQVNTEQMRSSD